MKAMGIKIIFTLVLMLVVFFLIGALMAKAHSNGCNDTWGFNCTIKCTYTGGSWAPYDACISSCSQGQTACEMALRDTATDCNHRHNHCTAGAPNIGISVSAWDNHMNECNRQLEICQSGEKQSAPPPPPEQPIGCGSENWDFNGSCVTKDQWCVSTYGANFHEKDGGCNCFDGYWDLNGACVTPNEWCSSTYGNSHEENGECPCDAGYAFLNGACITDNQWCKTTYGEGYYKEGDFCVSKSQPIQTPTPPSIPPSTPSASPQSPQRRELTSQEIQAITVYLFGAMGYDADDFDQAMETIGDIFKTARGLPSRNELNNKALTKRKDADKEFVEAARDGRIKDSAVREKIRKMYLDSWLDNPQDKKTDMMMAIFEKDKGNLDTADVFEKFAYMNLSQKERNTLTAAVNKAKESMSEKLMREEADRALLQKQLDNSAVMNLIRQNVNSEIAKAKETAKDACYGNSVCDWAWAKKVGVMTEAQKLSQNVSDFMNDPIKAVFDIDRKQIKKEFYGQTN